MILTLTRTYYNNDVMFGTLTCDTSPAFSILTMERTRPRDGYCYTSRCLPPGEYTCRVELSQVSYRDRGIWVPWIFIGKVNGQRMLGFYVDVTERPTKGMIALGYARDQFSLHADKDRATKELGRLAALAFDMEAQTQTEEVTLRVVEAEDMQYEDTSVEQVEKQRAYEEEMRQRAEMLNDFWE